MTGLLCNNSISTIFNKQFTNSSRIEGFRFGNATQQYFHYLLPDCYKQMEILNFVDRKCIVLNLDATGSLFSKPPYCSKKVFYYALTIQHPEFSTSPIPLAEMISSDHSTAEISHFLNKWCSSIKLFNNTDLKVKEVVIDFSWALIHITCLAFNKFTILSYLQNCWNPSITMLT